MRALHQIRADIMDAVSYLIYGEEVDSSEAPPPLEDLDIEATEKIRNCFFVVNRFKAEIAAAEVIQKTTADYISKRKAAVTKIEEDIRLTMEVMGLDKVDDPDCRVTLGKAREKAEIVDESKLAVEYIRVIPESKAPDKKAILEALKAGKIVIGAKIGWGSRSLTYPKIKGE